MSSGLNCLSSRFATGSLETGGRRTALVFGLPTGEAGTLARLAGLSATCGIYDSKKLAGHLWAGNYTQLKSRLVYRCRVDHGAGPQFLRG